MVRYDNTHKVRNCDECGAFGAKNVTLGGERELCQACAREWFE